MTESTGNSRIRQAQDDPRSELLSRGYRDAIEKQATEPSPSVDDAIRAAARRAAEQGVLVVFRRWRTPLALAATLLLAIGIALRVYNSGEMRMVLRPPVAGKSPEIQEQTDARIDEDGKPQPNSEEAPKDNKNGEVRRSGNAAPLTASRPPPAGETAAKPAIRRDEAAPLEGSAEDLRRQTETPVSPQSQATKRLEVQPTPTPFPTAPRAFPAPPPPSEPAAASRTAVPFQNTAPAASGSSGPALRARTEKQKAAAASVAAPQSLAVRLEERPAEEWIEEIRTLKRAGRGVEAAELLAAFRKKFPDFVLPEDLK